MSVNPFNLSVEELEIEDALNDANLTSVEDFEEMKKEAVQYAKNTLRDARKEKERQAN